MWRFYVLGWILCSCYITREASGYGTYSVTNQAAAVYKYDYDVIAGATTLFDDGNRFAEIDDKYHVYLMYVEGKLDVFAANLGFVIGYQWYNKQHSSGGRFKIQLYSLMNNTSYTLSSETDWIIPNKGFNSYNFDNAPAINDHTRGPYYGYIMAIMTDKNALSPVLHDYCVGDGLQIATASLDAEALIGDHVDFSDWSHTCVSFSLQALFYPTQFALPESNCAMFAVGDPRTLSSSGEEYDCWVMRVGNGQDDVIQVTPEHFSLGEDSDGCPIQSLRIEEIKELAEYSSSADIVIWGTYCGSKVFRSWTSSLKFMRVIFQKETNSVSSSFSLQIKSIKNPYCDNSYAAITIPALLGIFMLYHLLKKRYYELVKAGSNDFPVNTVKYVKKHLKNIDMVGYPPVATAQNNGRQVNNNIQGRNATSPPSANSNASGTNISNAASNSTNSNSVLDQNTRGNASKTVRRPAASNSIEPATAATTTDVTTSSSTTSSQQTVVTQPPLPMAMPPPPSYDSVIGDSAMYYNSREEEVLSPPPPYTESQA